METLSEGLHIGNLGNDSDPTYEAWKQSWIREEVWSDPYSDPTYEAWKLSLRKDGYSLREIIPILPMRHGN